MGEELLGGTFLLRFFLECNSRRLGMPPVPGIMFSAVRDMIVSARQYRVRLVTLELDGRQPSPIPSVHLLVYDTFANALSLYICFYTHLCCRFSHLENFLRFFCSKLSKRSDLWLRPGAKVAIYFWTTSQVYLKYVLRSGRRPQLRLEKKFRSWPPPLRKWSLSWSWTRIEYAIKY
jgi:hypothetical protein